MQQVKVINPAPVFSCSGNCAGCGKIHIRIFENHSLQAQELHENLDAALSALNIPFKILSAAAPEDAIIFGVSQFPALMLEQEVVCEGYVPSFHQIVAWLMERFSQHIKLHRFETITVPVDLSDHAANALLFAWEMAQITKSNIEVLHVMDSIFEGSKASSSGFLSGYGLTMQSELDSFIKSVIPAVQASENRVFTPIVSSKVLFGFPDSTILSYSQNCDFMVIGTTGRSGLSKRLLGSVSTEVSKMAHCPVLLVPGNARWTGMKDMVYTTDFESLDPVQIIKTVVFATKLDAKITFVHVGPAKDLNEVQLQEKFQSINELLPLYYQQAHLVKLVGESVMESLYEYTAAHKADLLVFITHERRFWENLLHKSITSEALTDAQLPVLVIHNEDR